MVPNPRLCGQKISFPVPPLPRRSSWKWELVIVLVTVLAVVVTRAFVLPWAICVLVMGARNRRARRPQPPSWVSLGTRALFIDGVSFPLHHSEAFVEQGEVLVVRRTSRTLRLDLRSLRQESRWTFIRHVAARQRLVRGPRRPYDHAIALEAFFVYDAYAVRVRGHVVREVVPQGRGWDPPRRGETLYVRERPEHSGSPYRMAPMNVVALGEL